MNIEQFEPKDQNINTIFGAYEFKGEIYTLFNKESPEKMQNAFKYLLKNMISENYITLAEIEKVIDELRGEQ